eukprot:359526-Chlamydomonas_euryale.AAC.2
MPACPPLTEPHIGRTAAWGKGGKCGKERGGNRRRGRCTKREERHLKGKSEGEKGGGGGKERREKVDRKKEEGYGGK